MLFGFARLALLGFAVLTVIYLLVSLYSRSVRREKLEDQWQEEGEPGPREAFVAEGMKEYDRSLKRKLILGVYVVPVITVGCLIYAINFW